MTARRGLIPFVPAPDRVGDRLIEESRAKIDGPIKRLVRRIYNPLYRMRNQLNEVGEGAQLGWSLRLPVGSRLGRYCYIGGGFDSPSPICVGDFCMISTCVRIVGIDHGIDDPRVTTRLDFRWKHAVTIFAADAWVGHGAILKSGIRVGRGSIIGAGAVVFKDVPDNSVVVGNPGRIIRSRFTPEDWSEYVAMSGMSIEASMQQ